MTAESGADLSHHNGVHMDKMSLLLLKGWSSGGLAGHRR